VHAIPIIRSRKLYIPPNPEGRNKEKSYQVYIYKHISKAQRQSSRGSKNCR